MINNLSNYYLKVITLRISRFSILAWSNSDHPSPKHSIKLNLEEAAFLKSKLNLINLIELWTGENFKFDLSSSPVSYQKKKRFTKSKK